MRKFLKELGKKNLEGIREKNVLVIEVLNEVVEGFVKEILVKIINSIAEEFLINLPKKLLQELQRHG